MSTGRLLDREVAKDMATRKMVAIPTTPTTILENIATLVEEGMKTKTNLRSSFLPPTTNQNSLLPKKPRLPS